MKELKAFGGTLIVAVPFQQGLVICADRLGTSGEGETEDTQKLYQIGPSAAFAATGITTFRDPRNPNIQYDACIIIDNFFSEQVFDSNNKRYTELAIRLTTEFSNFYWRFTNISLPTITVGGIEYPFFFRLIFFYLDQNQILDVETTDFIQHPENKQLALGRIPATEDELKGLTPMVYGDAAVFNEIMNGSDPRFDIVRNDPVIKRFVTGNAPAEQVTEEEALEFAKKLIVISSQMTPLITGRQTTIGEVIDSGILRYGSGFEWKEFNTPIE